MSEAAQASSSHPQTFTQQLLASHTDLRASKEIDAYLQRWGQYVLLGGVVGAAMGGIGNAVIAREEAMLEAEQAGQHLKTMPGFTQYRTNVHRNVARAAVRSSFKLAIFAGLFGGLELGMTYYRGVWDAWNPLLATTVAGGLFGLPAGFAGFRWGLTFGSILAVPVAMTEIAIHSFVPQSELMPTKRLVADPPEAMSKAVIEELQFELSAAEVKGKTNPAVAEIVKKA